MHLLGFDRESAMIAALASLVVAGFSVGVGALVMLRRERRAGTPSQDPRRDL
jgi:hypothetical protein